MNKTRWVVFQVDEDGDIYTPNWKTYDTEAEAEEDSGPGEIAVLCNIPTRTPFPRDLDDIIPKNYERLVCEQLSALEMHGIIERTEKLLEDGKINLQHFKDALSCFGANMDISASADIGDVLIAITLVREANKKVPF